MPTVKGLYKRHLATPEEYPYFRSIFLDITHPTLMPLTLLTPIYRLYSASGPATLEDLGVIFPQTPSRFQNATATKPAASDKIKHLYLETFWQHPPPDSVWSRIRGGGSLDNGFIYYERITQLLLGPGIISSPQRDPYCCMQPAVTPHDVYPRYREPGYIKSCSFQHLFPAYGDWDKCDTDLKTICMFDVLRAIEADRILRREWHARKAHWKGMKMGKRERKRHMFAGTWVSEVNLPEEVWRKWKKWQVRGMYDRCLFVEFWVARMLGIPQPPGPQLLWRDLPKGWNGDQW